MEPIAAEDFVFFETLLDAAEDSSPLSKEFYANAIQACLLHATKQKDYGKPNDPFANVRSSEEWGVPGWVGAMVRANDKVKRLQTFANTGVLANEGVRDSLLDIAVYSLIALTLFDEASS